MPKRCPTAITTATFLCLLGLCVPSSGVADRVYQFETANGATLFTDKDIPPPDYHLVNVRQYDWTFDPSPVAAADRDQYDTLIRLAAEQHSVDPALVKAVIHAESHFNAFAVSKAGAQGLMQLMPITASWLNVSNVFDAKQNISAGAELLGYLQQRFNNLDKALAAYNAGASNVEKYGGIPPFPETQRYVTKVKQLLPDYQQQFERPLATR